MAAASLDDFCRCCRNLIEKKNKFYLKLFGEKSSREGIAEAVRKYGDINVREEDICPNAQNIADQTREQKKCFKMFYRMFDRVQILPNTLKHVETCLNSTKQGGQTKNVLPTNNVLACLTVKHLPFGQAFKVECPNYFCNWLSFHCIEWKLVQQQWR